MKSALVTANALESVANCTAAAPPNATITSRPSQAARIFTALAATTTVRPLARLQQQASTLAERRGPWSGTFPGAARKDELGDLARALGELARRTNDHMALLQSFSADVSHAGPRFTQQ